MLFGDGCQGNKFGNAGIGENNVDSPLQARDGLVKTIKVSRFRNVSLNARDVGADSLHRFIEFLLAAAGDEHIGALFDEKLRGCQTNPLCPTADDGDLTFKLSSHCLVLFLPGFSELLSLPLAAPK